MELEAGIGGCRGEQLGPIHCGKPVVEGSDGRYLGEWRRIAWDHVGWMKLPGFGNSLEAVHPDDNLKCNSFELQKTIWEEAV